MYDKKFILLILSQSIAYFWEKFNIMYPFSHMISTTYLKLHAFSCKIERIDIPQNKEYTFYV